jgi:hypothetical protein
MEKRFKEIISNSLVTSLCCIAFGMIFYKGSVFTWTHYAFQFVSVGIAGSLFYHTLRLSTVKTALLVLAGLVFIEIAYDRSTNFWWVLRDILFGISLGSAIYLFYSNYYAQGKVRGVMIPVALGALLASTNLVVTIALLVLNGLPILPSYPTVLLNVMLGFLVGFGIGVGILVSLRVVPPSTS